MTEKKAKEIRNEYRNGKKKRLYHCSAWTYETENYIFLESYETIVAVYDKKKDKIYEYGRYSMTTYQHCRKFQSWLWENRKSLKEREWDIERENLELENWFAA